MIESCQCNQLFCIGSSNGLAVKTLWAPPNPGMEANYVFISFMDYVFCWHPPRGFFYLHKNQHFLTSNSIWTPCTKGVSEGCATANSYLFYINFHSFNAI